VQLQIELVNKFNKKMLVCEQYQISDIFITHINAIFL